MTVTKLLVKKVFSYRVHNCTSIRIISVRDLISLDLEVVPAATKKLRANNKRCSELLVIKIALNNDVNCNCLWFVRCIVLHCLFIHIIIWTTLNIFFFVKHSFLLFCVSLKSLVSPMTIRLYDRICWIKPQIRNEDITITNVYYNRLGSFRDENYIVENAAKETVVCGCL